MRRLLASAILLAALGGVMFLPALGIDLGDDQQAYEPTRITSYDADFRIDDDGDMDVVESITVDFPVSDRHGIFRFFDRVDPSVPEARRIVEDVEVTMDGGAVPVETSFEDGRYDVARIGDPDRFVTPGRHTYRISYHLPTVLSPGGEDVSTRSQFYWQLIPAGWAQDIDRAELTVHLPAPAEDLFCAVGIGAAAQECTAVTGDDGRRVVVTVADIDDHTPVAVGIGQDVPTPEPAVTRPWSPRFDAVLGPGLLPLGVVALIACGVAVLGWRLGSGTIQRPPRFPLQYAPPDGVGPAQGAYILRERVGNEQYVATLLHAAAEDAVELDAGAGGQWTITDKSGPRAWEGLDEVTYGVADLLPGAHGSFVADPSSVAAGRRLKKELESFDRDARDWAAREGLMAPAGVGGGGIVLVLIGLAVVGAATFWNPFHFSLVGLPAAAFVAAAWPIALPGAGTKRTAPGRELWSRIGGFQRVLSTPSSEERFDFSGRKELYTAYIPWAVAFGCADAWAEKYRVETAEEPPVPAYLGGHHGVGVAAVSTMVASFDSTLSSAISSYEATQRSSSSGGGDFSGGGGGGGGGGGSW